MTRTEAQGRIQFLEAELRAVRELVIDVEERFVPLRREVESVAARFENKDLPRRAGATILRDQLRRCVGVRGLLRGTRERIEAAL